MNLYTVTFTRNGDGIKSETILAKNEPQARAIFADAEILRVELVQENYDAELESQINAAKIWADNMHVTDEDAKAVHNYIVAAEAGDRAALAYGDADLTKLPPANGITTLQELADAKERSFNRRYYNNPNGEPKFVYRSNRQP